METNIRDVNWHRFIDRAFVRISRIIWIQVTRLIRTRVYQVHFQMKNDEKKYENKRTSCICIIFKYMDQSTSLFSSTRVFYTSFAISTWRSVRAYANSMIVPLLSSFHFISYSFVLFFIFLFCVDTRSFFTFVAFDLPDGQKVAQKIKLKPRQTIENDIGLDSPIWRASITCSVSSCRGTVCSESIDLSSERK